METGVSQGFPWAECRLRTLPNEGGLWGLYGVIQVFYRDYNVP